MYIYIRNICVLYNLYLYINFKAINNVLDCIKNLFIHSKYFGRGEEGVWGGGFLY